MARIVTISLGMCMKGVAPVVPALAWVILTTALGFVQRRRVLKMWILMGWIAVVVMMTTTMMMTMMMSMCANVEAVAVAVASATASATASAASVTVC